MITEKTHELITAYFTNDDKTLATAEWKEKSTGKIVMEAIVCKKGEIEWDRLLTLKTEDELYQITYQRNAAQREAFEAEIIAIAKREGIWADVSENSESLIVRMAEYMLLDENQIDAELLFRVKLKLFENTIVTESKNRDLKAELRKAKTYYDTLMAFRKFKK